MIAWSVAWPAIGALAAGLAVALLQGRLRPSAAAALLTILAGVAATVTVAVVGLLAGAFLAQIPGFPATVEWCLAITQDHRVPLWLGGAAMITVVTMAVSVLRSAWRLRVHGSDEPEALVIVPTDEPTAFAVPGRPGHIVVSAGMLRQLDGAERRVLLAHEQAHLSHHHHRYVWIATMAAAIAPPLRPVLARVRFATERWADEAAVDEVGDRELVARTIARAALVQVPAPVPALAFGGIGVAARVEAILHDPARSSLQRAATTAVLAATVAGIASAALQLHHVAAVVAHICG